MRDYLREFCTNFDIELIYTEGEITALSVGIKSNSPFIKANKIFERCPEKVAKAIMDYYTGSQNEHDSLKILKNYMGENVVSIEYTIGPPDEKFKNLSMKHIKTDTPPQSMVEEQRTSKEKTIRKSASKSNAPKKSESKVNTPKKSSVKDKGSEEVPKGDLSSLIEMQIASIIKSNFWGESSVIKPDEAIIPSTDDVISLEIEINDSKK